MINYLLTAFFIHATLLLCLTANRQLNIKPSTELLNISYTKKPSPAQKPLELPSSRNYAKSLDRDSGGKKTEKVDLTDYANQLKVLIDPIWVEQSANFYSKYYLKLLILTDKYGRIISVRVVNSSGVRKIDQTAINVFNEVGKFPQPPDIVIQKGIEWELSNF